MIKVIKFFGYVVAGVAIFAMMYGALLFAIDITIAENERIGALYNSDN
jgi:hypothetical protein